MFDQRGITDSSVATNQITICHYFQVLQYPIANINHLMNHLVQSPLFLLALKSGSGKWADGAGFSVLIFFPLL